MDFVFRPEKLTPELIGQVSEAIAKRTEKFSREKFPSLWEKTDRLNARNLSEAALKRRIKLRRFYGIICIALGIFLFIPGLVKPDELAVPLAVGAFATVFGISAVIPRKTDAKKFEKKAKKLVSAINSSLKNGDTVIFNDEGVFENGTLLMEYENMESPIENRSIFLFCDGVRIMVLRKADLVLGDMAGFKKFIEEKIKGES